MSRSTYDASLGCTLRSSVVDTGSGRADGAHSLRRHSSCHFLDNLFYTRNSCLKELSASGCMAVALLMVCRGNVVSKSAGERSYRVVVDEKSGPGAECCCF
eukprot:scpid109662/ scgid28405/ 